MTDSYIGDRVTDGVVVIGHPTDRDAFSLSRLRTDAARIASGEVDALAYGPTGRGRQVLAIPGEFLLMREDSAASAVGSLTSRLARRPEAADEDGFWAAILDAQWQLTLRGQKVLALEGPGPRKPTSARASAARRQALLEMMQANLSEEWRGVLLPWAQLSMVSGDLQEFGTDTSLLDLQRSPGHDDVGTLTVSPFAMAGAVALDAAAGDLPELLRRRDVVQSCRRLPDRSLSPFFSEFLPVLAGEPSGRAKMIASSLRTLLKVDDLFDEPIHVLVDDGVSHNARRCLGVLGDAEKGFSIEVMTDRDRRNLARGRQLLAWADVAVVTQPSLMSLPFLVSSTVTTIVDLSLTDAAAVLGGSAATSSAGRDFKALCTRADRILVGDEKSRDVILGALAGAHRINDLVYDSDPSLSSLVAVDTDGGSLVDFCRRPLRSIDRATPPPDAHDNGVPHGRRSSTRAVTYGIRAVAHRITHQQSDEERRPR